MSAESNNNECCCSKLFSTCWILHYEHMWKLVLRFTAETYTVIAGIKLPNLPLNPLCNQASQAEVFWKGGRPTLAGEPESQRSFQGSGSSAGVTTCTCVTGKQWLALTYKVISEWATDGNWLQDPVKYLLGGLLVYVCCGILPSTPPESQPCSLSLFPLVFLPVLTLNCQDSRVSSNELTPSKRNVCTGWIQSPCTHTNMNAERRRHAHTLTQLSLEVGYLAAAGGFKKNTYWNHSHSLTKGTLLTSLRHQSLWKWISS